MGTSRWARATSTCCRALATLADGEVKPVVLDWNESGGTVWVGRRADVLMAAAPVGPAPSEAVAAWLLARLDREAEG